MSHEQFGLILRQCGAILLLNMPSNQSYFCHQMQKTKGREEPVTGCAKWAAHVRKKKQVCAHWLRAQMGSQQNDLAAALVRLAISAVAALPAESEKQCLARWKQRDM
jgi:hypothetical protein